MTRLALVRWFGAIALTAAAVSGCNDDDLGADDTDAGRVTESLTDGQIAAVLEVVNRGEIDQARLAETRALSPSVLDFAAHMIEEHTNNIQMQSQLLQQESIVPMPNAMSARIEAEGMTALQMLQTKQGAEFDRAYIDTQAMMHSMVLTMLDTQLIPSADDEQYRAFLVDTRAHVQEHRDRAVAIQTELNATR